MHRFEGHYGFGVALVAAAVLSLAGACKDDSPKGEQTEGGENAIDSAHQDFQREVDPAADWVDEKANKTAEEGKKAASKTADAVDDAVDGDDE